MRPLARYSILLAILAAPLVGAARQSAADVQFVFLSDVHFGIERASFRGDENVGAAVVNAAMVERLNALPDAAFPKDGGVASEQRVGPMDFLAVGGDIANRREYTEVGLLPSAARSWAEFESVYIGGLTLHDRRGQVAPLFVVPGNHDLSNAIGHYKMPPGRDPTSVAGIFNLMMPAGRAKTSGTLDYARDRMQTSRDIGGIHVMFLSIWPDSRARTWMDQDLAGVRPSTPVFVFAHDPPDGDPKHFINPNGAHDINPIDQFENLLSDRFADGPAPTVPPVVEQRELEHFLRRHPNVTAYFHGHANFNQFYDWTGPDHSVVLHAFRVDSPMKGAVSVRDETKLSFQVASLDMAARTMTVRECFWNADPAHPNAPLAWGGSTTVALSPRPRR